VDLAISQDKRADDTVVMVLWKHKEWPNWYVMEYVDWKFDPLQTIDIIFSLYIKYRPLRVWIESVAYQKALSYFIT
jgi:hypothetical protein